MNGPINIRGMGDALLSTSVALPNAGATVTSAAIDLVNNPIGRGAMDGDLVITAPTVAGVDTKVHTYTVLECDTLGGSYTAAVGLGALPTNVAASSVYPAYSTRLKLQPNTKRFIKLQVVGTSSGGDASGVSATMALKF